jgi:2-methylcitrate dehydratase PrpD
VEWACRHPPDPVDTALAQRSLLDTAAVALAARDHPVRALTAGLPDAARWAAVAHVLDFDDLHIDSTTHISVVIVPAVLAAGGGANAYLAGAGVMARLGRLLGWSHYTAGWHPTCTAGAPAAAVAAGVAWGLTPRQLATAMALAVPGAGGVQAAFGTHGKALQVGFAADTGVRAARLARDGATADPRALDAWLRLVGAAQERVPGRLETRGPAVPGGLALKMHPCCYAMQRPLAALRELGAEIRSETGGDTGAVTRVIVRTPAGTVQPLIHARPRTGLEGKFSLEYAVAAALLDGYPGFSSFTDAAVNRPEAQRLSAAVETVETVRRADMGEGLLAGEVDIAVHLTGGRELRTRLAHPPGSPRRPPSPEALRDKFAACGTDVPELLDGADWARVRALLHDAFPTEPGTRTQEALA